MAQHVIADNQFDGDFHGDLIRPDDPGYGDARVVWNGMIDKRPALIERCRGVADVRVVVDFVRENDVPVSIRGGGHNVAGGGVSDDGVVIDLSEMRGVGVEPENDDATVGGVRDCLADMRQFSDGSIYLNYPGFFKESDDAVQATYGSAYDRLTALKKTNDPTNLFDINQTVASPDRAGVDDGEREGGRR